MTIREALANGRADLKSAGIESSSLDVSLLLAHVLNTTRTALLAKGTDTFADNALAAFRALIKRRLNGECAAYILGKKEFMGLEFLVNPSVLVPRPETETLVDTAIAVLTDAINKDETAGSIRILDLCTGSGAIAVSIKSKLPQVKVCAADICAQALETAKTNAARLLPPDSVKFYQGDLFVSDLFATLPLSQFSVIVSNPPYIPTEEIKTLAAEVQNEPRLALDGGDTGLEIIERIIEGAPEFLRRSGTLLLEADPRQMENIAVLLERKGFKDVKLYRDLSGHERVISGIYEK
jgi:release factor glutamine methyltransferase